MILTKLFNYKIIMIGSWRRKIMMRSSYLLTIVLFSLIIKAEHFPTMLQKDITLLFTQQRRKQMPIHLVFAFLF